MFSLSRSSISKSSYYRPFGANRCKTLHHGISFKSGQLFNEMRPIFHSTKRHLGRGSWVEKETLKEYVRHKMKDIGEYMATITFSEKEKLVMEKLKADFFKKSDVAYENTYPLKPSLAKSAAGQYSLTFEEMASYSKDGLAGPYRIKSLSKQSRQSIFKRYTGIPDNLGSQAYREARVRQEWQSRDILDLATNEEIIQRVASILGENVKVRFTGIHEVPPNLGSFSSLTNGKVPGLCAHSDMNLGARLSKRDLDGPLVDLDSINVWVSISGTNAQNAPLYVFPGTHNWAIATPRAYLDNAKHEEAALERTFRLLSMRGFGTEMIACHALYFEYLQTSRYRHEIAKVKRTEIYTEPGDCLIFSTHLLHGSHVNCTSEPRLGISIRYSRATNPENDDTLNAMTTMFSSHELWRMGLKETDKRNPIIQVSGKDHHPRSVPINLPQLRNILSEKT